MAHYPAGWPLATAPQLTQRGYAIPFGGSSCQMYLDDEHLCCGLTGDRAELLSEAWTTGLLSHLMATGLLAPATPSETCYPFTLRLNAPSQLSYVHEWCGQMWKAAAICIVDLMTELADHALTLHYPNPWNVLFRGTYPEYVNIGSLYPLTSQTFTKALARLKQCFLYPLYLCRSGRSRLAHTLLRDPLRGVDSHDFPEFAETEQRCVETLTASAAKHRLTAVRAEIESIAVPETKTKWSTYNHDWPLSQHDAWGWKQRAVHQILMDLHPTTVLDVASNVGWYSRLAASEGAQVIAVDIDETCINRLYRFAKSEGRHVLPLVFDIMFPSSAFGLSDHWFPPACERLKADLVLALAVTHHLVFAGIRLDFDDIVKCLAAFVRRALLVEFVPLQSDGCPYRAVDYPAAAAWYDLDHFVSALQRRFASVMILPSQPTRRTLVLCQTPRS